MFRFWLFFFAVLAFLGCAEVPDELRNGANCNGRAYTEYQFCANGRVYDFCGGTPYNPDIVDCCNNHQYTKSTEFCSGGLTIYRRCGGMEYDPSTQRCQNDVVQSLSLSSSSVGGSSSSLGSSSSIYINCSLNGGTVTIGEQVWMKENLNCYVSGSKCYGETDGYGHIYDPKNVNTTISNAEIQANCTKYGRLYDWETAKKVCPSGWHLPSNKDWDKLVRYIDGDTGTYTSEYSAYESPTAGRYLKSKSGWNNSGNGEDKYGFSALPSGGGKDRSWEVAYQYSAVDFRDVGYQGWWWSSSAYYYDYSTGRSDGYYWNMDYRNDSVSYYRASSSVLYSVRCVQNYSSSSSSSSVSYSSSSRSSSSVALASSDGCERSCVQKSDFSCKWDKEGVVLPGQMLKPVAEGSTIGCTVQWNFKDGPLSECYKTTSDGFSAEYPDRYYLFAELTCGGAKYVHACSPTDDINLPTSVKIGTQTWHKCNLNVVPSTGKSACYDNKPENCDKLGRLYDWEAAMNVCPFGWHLPSHAEWDVLMTAVGGAGGAGYNLKAKIGWDSNGNGTDNYGFSALPGGHGLSDGSFSNVGYYGDWWSRNEFYDSYHAYSMYMSYDSWRVDYYTNDKSYLYSVRCLQD